MLVQREEQITRLREAFRMSEEQQRGHVSLVTGAVGSGKTSVLESFGEWAVAAGGRVLSAAGSRAERGLHLGVLGQLFHSARLGQEAAARVEKLMREAPSVVPLLEASLNTTDESSACNRAWAPVLHGLFTTLLDLAEPGPLVLTIDDVHHADPATLHCLLYVTRRLRHAPIVVVLTEATMLRPPHPHFRAELFSQPHFTRITLPLLTVEAIAELVGGGTEAAVRETAERCLSITGGNPLLTRALIDERPREESDEDPAPDTAFGDAFDQAVLGCLYRHEPGLRRVAQALAVLSRPAPTELLGHLLDIMSESVVPAVRVLRTSGLMNCDQLRHPRIRRSILGDMSTEERRATHQRAAEVLHEHGIDPRTVAEHLVAAGWAEAAWTVPVLQNAAAQALASGRPHEAAACLRLVSRADVDDQQRTTTTAMLIKARWQVNPLTVNGHLTQLVRTARDAGWPADTTLSAVPYLLWQGRAEEAAEAIVGCGTDDDQAHPADASRLGAMRLLLSLSHPDHLPAVREAVAAGGRMPVLPAVGHLQLHALTVLGSALTPAAEQDAVATAEQLLHRHHTDDGVLPVLTAPLLALLWSGRSDRVAVWSGTLLDRPAVRHTPVWRAVIRSLRAEAALRLGDLSGAEQHARAALEDLPVPAWGVAAAGPLATLIACATESGRHGEADQWLARPLPPGAFHTPLGVHYLAARGRHHLALGRAHAATADLLRCGELMRTWGIDVAGLVPWRLELARVQLSVGNKAHANQLLQEQLRVPHGVDDRTHGRTLRLLATTAAPDHRRKLLFEAVNLLQNCGDRLELVRALGDTGQTLQRAGDWAQARLLVRRAYHLAQDCGAPVLAQRLVGREPGGLPGYPPAETPESEDGLSEAERRVAALAVQGHTNREISSKLFITVSTVEQHLTRVYRKLDVKRRSDLPTRLVAYAEPLAEEVQGAAS
ncbi:helix-turn-helix transcriptional regulator [Micromonospora sp. NBC_00421]|uniref:helix-turn-helix transcriptional regulator n=1 Tax=Micromonospora sp. NBC_00421 TaxID=2975976 RepID=UPI002E208C71